MRGYYFITDPGLTRKGIMDDVRKALDAGCCIIQYRNKTGTTREMYEEAKEICKLVGQKMQVESGQKMANN